MVKFQHAALIAAFLATVSTLAVLGPDPAPAQVSPPTPAPPSPGGGGSPGGSSGQLQYNNAGAFGGFTASQDCTVNPATGAFTCLKTNNVAFTGAATAPFQTAGSWTPADASGAGLTFTGVSAGWSRVGNMVYAYATVTWPGTANAANAGIGGLPVTVPAAGYAEQCSLSYTNNSSLDHMKVSQGTTNVMFYNTAGVGIANSTFSGLTVNFMCIYPAT